MIKATTEDTDVTATAGASFSATNAASIDALTIAGSAAVSTESDAFGGAGAVAFNFIDAHTEASHTGGAC